MAAPHGLALGVDIRRNRIKFRYQMKKNYWFKHDQNAASDLKIVAMLSDYGMSGYGMFWIIVENLRASSGYQIQEKDYNINSLAYQMRIHPDQVKRFINDCVDKYELFIRGDGFFYSMRLLDDMAQTDHLHDVRKEAGKKGAESRWEK
jgi:hypothetical protein